MKNWETLAPSPPQVATLMAQNRYTENANPNVSPVS